MPESFDAVVAGHICLDIIPGFQPNARLRPEDLFAPGRLIAVEKAMISSGGPVANTGIALRKLGMRIKLMGKIGTDLFGRALREIVTSSGTELATEMIEDGKADTSYTIILNPPGVDRIFLHHPAANDTFDANDVRFDIVQRGRLFHFGYPPVMRRMYENGGRELTELFRRAKETGVTTSLDMTLPDPASDAGRADWKAILRATLPFVDIFMPSLEEIVFMLRRDEYTLLPESLTPELLSGVGRELIDMGAKIVGCKLGDRGLYLRTAARAEIEKLGRARPLDIHDWADREAWAPCFQVNVAGTTGAGDATISGFLSALLRNLPCEEAVTMAVAVGACCVEATDAVGGIRSWEETRQRINGGWPRREFVLSGPRWRQDTQNRLWTSSGLK
jgi:sugar/nucleoside kinase (ribokinase family)